MCGIAGFFSTERGATDRSAAVLAALKHRGPDSSGTWHAEDLPLTFVHARLSIIDLSVEGHQPMHSASGRFAIVFNGEIYNYAEIQIELRELGHSFRGHSDTEVMLAAFEEWGIERSVSRFIGMFAFVVWDKRERQLSLVRDRIGVKPLYYGWHNAAFVFGSELKALTAAAPNGWELDRQALMLYLRHLYVPAPRSIYQGVYKLLPGTILTLSEGDLSSRPTNFTADTESVRNAIQPKPYWDLATQITKQQTNISTASEAELVDQLEVLLKDCVALRMVSDVPIGAFLSGGVDSSLVVALMQAQSAQPVRSFCIGFHEKKFDEAGYARDVARHLGTQHTEYYLSADEALTVVPSLATIFDEPFGDSSQIPTLLVSKLARSQVTVSLSGDGGDELFMGYSRYLWGSRAWQILRYMPTPMRYATAAMLRTLSPRQWDAVLDFCRVLIPSSFNFHYQGDKVHKLAEVLSVKDANQLYFKLLSVWRDPELLVHSASEPETILNRSDRWPTNLSYMERMSFCDSVSYLPDDILTKVDRASMAVSLESREPLLDHRLFEFVWGLPRHMRETGAETKKLLRQVLYRYVPQTLIDRPKMGFGIPVAEWLRGPLKGWAEDLLTQEKLAADGILNPAPIRQKWKEHLSGERNWHVHLWSVLMFQAWKEKY